MPVAATTKVWTLKEVHSLPDDGNKYELVRGELFVTPAPSDRHETVLARLTEVLGPFVARHRLGRVYHPRAVVRFEGSEVEPDLMVRAEKAPGTRDWDEAPTPVLIVEVHSRSTRGRDRAQKRSLYLDAGVAEYWMIDPDARTLTAVRAGTPDVVTRDEYLWQPADAADPLSIRVTDVLGVS